jgi:hypothetical protein
MVLGQHGADNDAGNGADENAGKNNQSNDQ